jgi:hypothetical protein
MLKFSKPFTIGNAYGPGKEVVTCLACGSLVLPSETERHDDFHERLSALTRVALRG